MAEPAVEVVRAPTVFVVGDEDATVLELNEVPLGRLTCEREN